MRSLFIKIVCFIVLSLNSGFFKKIYKLFNPSAIMKDNFNPKRNFLFGSEDFEKNWDTLRLYSNKVNCLAATHHLLGLHKLDQSKGYIDPWDSETIYSRIRETNDPDEAILVLLAGKGLPEEYERVDHSLTLIPNKEGLVLHKFQGEDCLIESFEDAIKNFESKYFSVHQRFYKLK
jgi:hypothetical protein